MHVTQWNFAVLSIHLPSCYARSLMSRGGSYIFKTENAITLKTCTEVYFLRDLYWTELVCDVTWKSVGPVVRTGDKASYQSIISRTVKMAVVVGTWSFSLEAVKLISDKLRAGSVGLDALENGINGKTSINWNCWLEFSQNRRCFGRFTDRFCTVHCCRTFCNPASSVASIFPR